MIEYRNNIDYKGLELSYNLLLQAVNKEIDWQTVEEKLKQYDIKINNKINNK